MDLPDDVLRTMWRQHGVIGRSQLLESVNPRRIETLVRRRRFIPVERGVYRVIGGVATPEQRAMAAVLRARPGARLTGPFVLGLFHVDGFTTADPFEVLTAPRRHLRGVAFEHRRDPRPTAGWSRVRGLPIAGIEAAVIDAWRYSDALGERRLRLAYDQVRWRGMTTPERLLHHARALGPRDVGAARFLEWAGPNTVPESEGERRVGALLSRIHPPPEPQVWVLSYRLDWYWRSYRLGVEYLGGLDHTSGDDRERDGERASRLADHGVRMLTVTYEDLRDEGALVQWVTTELQGRARQLGLPEPSLVTC